MSFYIIEDDDGKLLTNDGYFDNTMVYARLYDEPSEPEHDVEEFGGHVVELIENPAPVVVSEEEAEILRMAKTSGHPYGYIYAHTHTAVNEDRLMRAYVNGYTVAKAKKYNLVLGSDTDDGTNALFKLVNYNPCTDDALGLNTDTYADDLKLDELYQFTQEEIDKYNKDFWIKGIDLNNYKVEVEE